MNLRQPLSDRQLERLAFRLAFRTPPVKFRKIVDAMPFTVRDSVSRKLDGLVSAAATAAGYFGVVPVFPSTNHDRAVKNMNQVVRKVRKALGYDNTRDIPM